MATGRTSLFVGGAAALGLTFAAPGPSDPPPCHAALVGPARCPYEPRDPGHSLPKKRVAVLCVFRHQAIVALSSGDPVWDADVREAIAEMGWNAGVKTPTGWIPTGVSSNWSPAPHAPDIDCEEIRKFIGLTTE